MKGGGREGKQRTRRPGGDAPRTGRGAAAVSHHDDVPSPSDFVLPAAASFAAGDSVTRNIDDVDEYNNKNERCVDDNEHEEEDQHATEEEELAYVLLRGTPVRIVVNEASTTTNTGTPACTTTSSSIPTTNGFFFDPVQVVLGGGAGSQSRSTTTTTASSHSRGGDDDDDDDPNDYNPNDEGECECCHLTVVAEPLGQDEEGRQDSCTSTSCNGESFSSSSSSSLPSSDRPDVHSPSLHPQQPQQHRRRSRYKLDWDRVVPFSGHHDDRRCCASSCHGRQRRERPSTSMRSDAALLLGLLKAVEPPNGGGNSALVAIKSVFLQVHGPWNEEDDDNDDAELHQDKSKAGGRTQGHGCDWECSLLVTLHFPHLDSSMPTTIGQSPLTARDRISIVPRHSAATASTPPPGKQYYLLKPLDPATRLLLALCRSDWEVLGHLVHAEEAESASSVCRRRQRVPFFPPQLTMEHLYRQLPSSNDSDIDGIEPDVHRSVSEDYRRTSNDEGSSTGDSLLLQLPSEVLRNNVAAYLHARELDAIRTTCRSLRHTMRDVVPGLKLKLYRHQVSSLVWMRRREMSVPVPQLYPSADDRYHGIDVRRGPDGAGIASMGRSVVLRPRPTAVALPSPAAWNRKSRAGSNRSTAVPVAPRSDLVRHHRSVRICTTYGVEVDEQEEADANTRSCIARGGLLCDDPGLGKTITVLALILQTYGLSTITSDDCCGSQSPELASDPDYLPRKPPEEEGVDEVFFPYWNERVTSEFRRPLLTKLVNDLLRNHRGSGVIATADVKKLRANIEGDSYGSNFRSFERDVESAITSCDSCSDQESASLSLLSEFQDLVRELKRSQLKSAKKSFSNTHGRHQSRAAAAIAKQAQEQYLSRLVPSSSTLIVIPYVLMEHWQTQILTNVDMNFVSGGKIPLVFEYGKSAKDGMSVHKADKLCRLHRSHMPLLFVDRGGTRPLPSAEFLAMFRIVLSSTDRFKNEWSRGSFESELRQAELATSDAKPDYVLSFDSPEEACPLLKVNWLRLVVDEGHSMGKGQLSSTIQFASWVTAQRRWAMTGTPTKHSPSELNQVKGLLAFLKHDDFGNDTSGSNAWRSEITKPWHQGFMFAFFRLKALLSHLMKRHTKLDIAELPPPRFRRSLIPMSFIEATTYNTLVCGVQSNLLLTSMKGKTSGEMDSLVHRSQSKHAREALANVRRVCVGWSRVVPTLELRFFIETLQLLEAGGIDEKTIEGVRRYLIRAQEEQLTPCGCCGLQLSTPLLLSCCGGHVCPECMDNASNTCLLCDETFDVDEFQRLQPGFVLMWKSNVDSAKATKHSAARASTSDTAVGDQNIAIDVQRPPAVMHRPDEIRRRTRRLGDGHTCEYDATAGDGVCKLCYEPHDSCTLFNESSRCPICHAVAQDCPEDESKASFLVSKLCDLLRDDRKHDRPAVGSRPLKVIVYSQFRQALNVVGDRLLKRFGTKCVAEYWGKFRVQELHKFTADASCFCMLLSNDGSEGLDLSFVTHIFFLEEIWDASLRDQAVARAWRMGAKGRVEVETLLAKNSVEETMQEIESSLLDSGEQDDARHSDLQGMRSLADFQQAKTKILLQSLRFILDYHGIRSQSDSWSRSDEQVSLGEPKGHAMPFASSPPLRKRLLPCEEIVSSTTDPAAKRVRFEDYL